MSVLPTHEGERVFTTLRNRKTSEWDAIVIGSGMGGMSCATALSHYGYRVLLLEQHYIPGGYTHMFKRRGFHWDVGVHILGEMVSERIPGRVLDWLSGGEVEMVPIGNPYDHFYYPEGFDIGFPDSFEEFEAILKRKFPGEDEQIEKYLAICKKASREVSSFFVLKTMPQWMANLGERVVKTLSRDWWTVTTEEILQEIGVSHNLGTVLTAQWGYYGSVPRDSSFAFHAMTAVHFGSGAYFPKDGSKAFAASFLHKISEAGGETICGVEVDEVLVENGRAVGVKLESGEVFKAKHIVSAAGAKNTVNRLVPDEYQKTEWARAIRDIPSSPPYLAMNLGFEGDIHAAGARRCNRWYNSSWGREETYWDVDDPKKRPHILYVSFPSLKDPNHEPGEKLKHTGEVVTFIPWSAVSKWQKTEYRKRPDDYKALKESIEQRILSELRTQMPEIMKHLVYYELSTPLTAHHFARAHHGAIYGLDASPQRFNCQHLRTRTPIDNLYMTGVDVASIGVIGAMISGMLTAATIDMRIFRHLL